MAVKCPRPTAKRIPPPLARALSSPSHGHDIALFTTGPPSLHRHGADSTSLPRPSPRNWFSGPRRLFESREPHASADCFTTGRVLVELKPPLIPVSSPISSPGTFPPATGPLARVCSSHGSTRYPVPARGRPVRNWSRPRPLVAKDPLYLSTEPFLATGLAPNPNLIHLPTLTLARPQP